MLPPQDGTSAVAQPYASRKAVGELLAVLHQETRAIAAHQRIAIEHLRARVRDIDHHGDRYFVTLDDGEIVETGAVVLSLGLVPIERFPHLVGAPGYCGDGWNPARTLAGLDRGEQVVIVGNGPTAIDLYVRLEDRNLSHPVVMISRTGQLPAVRPVLDPTPRAICAVCSSAARSRRASSMS